MDEQGSTSSTSTSTSSTSSQSPSQVFDVSAEFRKPITRYPEGTAYFHFVVTDRKNRYIRVPWQEGDAMWVETNPIQLDVFSLSQELSEKLAFFQAIDGMEVGPVKSRVVEHQPFGFELILKCPVPVDFSSLEFQPMMRHTYKFSFPLFPLAPFHLQCRRYNDAYVPMETDATGRVKEFVLPHWGEGWQNFRNVACIRLRHQMSIEINPALFLNVPLCLQQYDTAIAQIADITQPVFADCVWFADRAILPPGRCDGLTAASKEITVPLSL